MVKYMFDIQEPGCVPGDAIPVPDAPAVVPLERLEAQIRASRAPDRGGFLVLLGDFDARRGWASWEMPSCAVWLSWKCQMSSGTAGAHPGSAGTAGPATVITAEFAASGRLSYAKVRALTRIATRQRTGPSRDRCSDDR